MVAFFTIPAADILLEEFAAEARSAGVRARGPAMVVPTGKGRQ